MFYFRLGPSGSTWGTSAWMLVASLSIAPAMLYAQESVALDLGTAVTLAVERSQSLNATQASARAAHEMAVVAGQRPDPVLRLSLDNLPVNGPQRGSTTADFMTMRSIGVVQTLPNEAKRRSRARRFEQQAMYILAQQALQASEVRRAAAEAWFERRAAEQRIAILERQIAQVRLQVLATQAAVRSGRVSLSEALMTKDALVSLEQAHVLATTELSSAALTLARWTGLGPKLPLAPPPNLSVSALDRLESDSVLEQHPALAVWNARVLVAKADADLSHQERTPDFSVELMFSQRGPGYSDMVSVGVSVPLALHRAHRQDRELAARLAEVQALDAEWQEARRTTQLELAIWHRTWKTALEQLEMIDRQRVPLAAQRGEAALAAYRSGTSPLTAVLEARQAQLVLAVERIETERRAARAWAALEFLLPTESTTRVAR